MYNIAIDQANQNNDNLREVLKMNVKKILSLMLALVFVVTAFAGCSGKSGSKKNGLTNEAGVVVMATEATFPPYEYMDGLEIAGVDVDVANEIAKELGVELRVDNISFDGIIPAITSGKADFGAAGMSITEDRKKQVDFSIEYAVSTQVILTTADSGITSVEDLDGKNVGVQMGTISDIVLSDENPEISLVRGKKYTDLAMEMENGKIEAIVLDNLPAQAMQKSNPDFVILETPFFTDVYAIAVDKGNTELLEVINKVLQRLIDEGKIEEYTNKHLG